MALTACNCAVQKKDKKAKIVIKEKSLAKNKKKKRKKKIVKACLIVVRELFQNRTLNILFVSRSLLTNYI